MNDFDLIGIGSALVDVTIKVDDSFLEKENLPKGGMTLIEAPYLNHLLESFSPQEKKLSPGGSTANVITSFSQLGGKGAFIGKVGNDELGRYFEEKTTESGVDFIKLTSLNTPTGTVISFITPDGERTFATYLGAATELSPDDLPSEILCNSPIIQVEAYMVFNGKLINHVLNTAQKGGQTVSLDFSSPNVVEENLDFFKEITDARKLNIIFANEEECFAFTKKSPEDSLELMASVCDTAIIKEGPRGSFLKDKKESVHVPALKIEVEDTNGAGDAYAGGVLFGISKKLSLKRAGTIGTQAGAMAVSQRGARLTPQNASSLLSWVENYLKS